MQVPSLEDYLSTPWVFGESDFEKGFDCSTQTVTYQCLNLGRFIPEAPQCFLDTHKAMRHALDKMYEYFKDDERWLAVALDEKPMHGDIVVMNKRVSKSGRPRHVGTYVDIDGGKILHTLQVLGARLTEPHRLADFDYKIIEIYRWQD